MEQPTGQSIEDLKGKIQRRARRMDWVEFRTRTEVELSTLELST